MGALFFQAGAWALAAGAWALVALIVWAAAAQWREGERPFGAIIGLLAFLAAAFAFAVTGWAAS